MKKIIVYCEVNLFKKRLEEVSYELISKAHDLSKNASLMSGEEYIVEAVALADELDNESIIKAFSAGAHNFVFVKNKCLEIFSQTVFAQCFIEYFSKFSSDIIIFPATPKGRMVAPRITTVLDTGLVADCTGLDFVNKDGKIYFAPTRPTFGSELMATILSKSSPQCATVREGVFKADFTKKINGRASEFCPTFYEESRIKTIKTVIDNTISQADFSNANIVLCAGYGLVEKKDRIYFERLEQIARIIGAKVGATRKVVDLGFMPQTSQIGQTGATINSDIYITFGVSGAIQHIAGIKNCKTIVAINNDENAEIFKYADYKIVADAKSIIENLLMKLEK